jgi:competence protein ComEA
MKSFLATLCILLSLMGATQPLMAKDAKASTGVGKVDTKNAVVNLNKADANTLQYYLTGIGAVRSKAIIDYRSEHGAFKSVDDLLKVTGIGKATLSGIKSNLSLSRGEYTAPKVAQSASGTKKTVSSSSKATSTDQSSEKTTASRSAVDTPSAKASADDRKVDSKSTKQDSKTTSVSGSNATSGSKVAKSSTPDSSSKDKAAAKSKSKSSEQSKSAEPTKKSSSKSEKDSKKKKVLPTDKKS